MRHTYRRILYDVNALFYSSIYFVEVVASGLWLAPGDSEEVAAALSQALRNRIERFVFIPFLDHKQYVILDKSRVDLYTLDQVLDMILRPRSDPI